MRLLSAVAVVSLVAIVGCKSKEKTADAPATKPAPAGDMAAPTPTTTKAEATAPAAAAAVAGTKLECAKKSDKRVLEVRAKDKGCELAYTKNGQEAVVASGRAGLAHCEGSREKIVEKLKTAGYTCN